MSGDKTIKSMGYVHYFAYGSNMSERRLKARVASAKIIQIAKLHAHQLRFHKRSLDDGSAKCDAFYTGNQQHYVWGVVYRLASNAISILDNIEGQGYDRVRLEVESEGGESINVISYVANSIDANLLPFEWYKRHVLVGARECGLATDYLAVIEAVMSKPDPDQERHQKELSIYD